MSVVRREAAPLRVHQLWDSVCTGGKDGVSHERLVELACAHMTEDEAGIEIERAVKDELIIYDDTKKVYTLPDPVLSDSSKGDHDWYCFKCHVGGEVMKCEDCPRVYHQGCLQEDEKKPKNEFFICPSCHLQTSKPSADKLAILKPKVLNQLLDYIIKRFREWDIDFFNKADGKIWAQVAKRPQKEAWRFAYFVYFPMDLTVMSRKAANSEYTSLEEFQVDCENIIHAIGVYFGTDQLKSNSLGASFTRDAYHDIQEIKLCHDCFRRSNEKDHAWWFCLPCTTPHIAVWAKQSGYPYWPAKVMKIEGNRYDVRYFGGVYERGYIDRKNIQPIETSLTTLKIRKNAAWNEAYDELQKFQEIALNPEKANSLPTRKGKASMGSSASPKGGKRANSEADTQVIKKSKTSTSPAKKAKVVATVGTSSGRVARKSVVETPPAPAAKKSQIQNGMPSAAKSTPQRKTSNVSSSNVGSATKPETSVDLRVLTQETVRHDDSSMGEGLEVLDNDDYSFLDQESSDSESESNDNDVYFSEDENAKGHEKVSEDAVSSSVVDSKHPQFRNVYTQATNAKAPLSMYWRNKYMRKLSAVKERFIGDISVCKKKQWCYNCEREAIYHCCWNTAYCSIECQQAHWTKEHKRLCRRVRRDRQGGGHDDY